jgi:fructoselysine-6-P-deglycase FrlB-like protein
MSSTSDEIASQPGLWPAATSMAAQFGSLLPAPGSSVAVIGCGTSLHIGRAWTILRETHGLGASDAFPASEVRWSGSDLAICISRSGTTSEVLWE